MENATAVIIGRFQVPYLHLGHIYLISYALQNYSQVLILLGESVERDERNPYTIYQRIQMIERVFGNRPDTGVLFDIPGGDQLWSETIDEILEKENNPVLLHSRDSFKDHYSGKYPVKEIPELPGYSGTKLREQLKT